MALGFATSTASASAGSPRQIERSEPGKVPEEFAFAAQFAVPYDNHHAAPCLACQHAFPLQPIVIVGQSAVLLEGVSMAVSSLALVSIEDQIFIDKMIHRTSRPTTRTSTSH
jgi:hypothetical protein